MRRLISFCAVTLAVAAVVLSAHTATAQTTNGASGLSISPTNTSLTIKPGQASSIPITLKNVTSGPITAKAFVNDFTSDNVDGNPQLILNTTQKSPNSIRDFLVGLQDVELSPGEQKSLTVAVQLPNNIAPGAYYGIVRYQAIPQGAAAPTSGQVSTTLSASVGSIVLISVPGKITQIAQLKAIHVYSGNNEGTLLLSKPTQVGIELFNQGNSFLEPFGRITVENMHGKTVYSYELNSGVPPANVLPNSTRIFKDAIKNVNNPGRYKVTASVSYGNGSQILTSEKTFWYIPLWLLLVIVAVLLVLVGSTFLAYRHYRRISRSAVRKRH